MKTPKWLILFTLFMMAAHFPGCRTTLTVSDLIKELRQEEISRQALAAHQLGELGVGAREAIADLIEVSPRLDEAVLALCRIVQIDREVFIAGYARFLALERTMEQKADGVFKALSAVKKMAVRCKAPLLELLPRLHQMTKQTMTMEVEVQTPRATFRNTPEPPLVVKIMHPQGKGGASRLFLNDSFISSWQPRSRKGADKPEISPLIIALRAHARKWRAAHPEGVFPNKLFLQADPGTDFTLLKHVMYSCQVAGYLEVVLSMSPNP